MEDKIGEIVTLLPYNIKARRVLGECCLKRRKDRKNIIYKPLTEEEI